MPKSLRPHAHHLDKRLRFRLRIYFLIALIFIGIFVFNIVRGTLRLDLGIAALAAGLGIGIVTSRMFHTSWNKDTQKVVSRLDGFGLIILAVYITFEVFRDKLVGIISHDFQVGTIGFAVLAGIMFGRVIGTRGKILEVLKEQKVF